jgi:hypothetical protein
LSARQVQDLLRLVDARRAKESALAVLVVTGLPPALVPGVPGDAADQMQTAAWSSILKIASPLPTLACAYLAHRQQHLGTAVYS